MITALFSLALSPKLSSDGTAANFFFFDKPTINNEIYCSSEDTSFNITPQLIANINKLSEIQNLCDNWNGYQAKSFSPVLIQKVQSILFQLNHQPQLFPTGRDSIQLEYEKENGDYLEFEIFSEKTIMLKIVDSEEIEKKINEKMIQKTVNEFYGRA